MPRPNCPECDESEAVTLSCGHEPSPHGEHATGTAHAPDGREICWGCATAEQRARMATEPRVVAYLVGDEIQTWNGDKLASVTHKVERRVGYGGSRVYLRVTDLAGRRWYGTSPGDQMYARLRACK